MRFLALIYTDPALAPPMSDSMNAAYFALNQKMQAAGVMVSGLALQPVGTARSVRLRDGKAEVMDGPFAETREHLGGYYLIDCADQDEALAWAAQIPGAAHGTVEVRPIVVFG